MEILRLFLVEFIDILNSSEVLMYRWVYVRWVTDDPRQKPKIKLLSSK